MSHKFAGKVAVVTGASKGIGAEIALELAKQGAAVVVNYSSMPVTGGSVYSATKAAIDAITKSLAKELGPRKIRVNSVNPGMVETEGVKTQGLDAGDFRRQMEQQTPLGRIGVPHDIAPAVAFLASSDAAWLTGESLVISGGLR